MKRTALAILLASGLASFGSAPLPGVAAETGADRTTSFTVEDYMGDFELRVKVISGSSVAYAGGYVNNMQ